MFCEDIAGFQIDDCSGMPVWMKKHEYLGNAEDDQLTVVSPHPWYPLHSQVDQSSRLRDLYKIEGRKPVRITAKDAAERGIENGDLVELYNDRGTILSDDIMPGLVSVYEGGWPSLDSKVRCNSGLVNFLTPMQRSSGLSQATTANTALCCMRKCEDPHGPNMAYEKPEIIEDCEVAAIDEDALGLDRVATIIETLLADASEGEKIFYERSTVCQGRKR